jgi:dihydrofolate reductase
VTYQEMARYWPQSGEPQARPMNTVPKLAVSATLTERRPGTTLAWQEGDLDREIRALKQQPGPARLVGSVRIARAMLGLRLADRLRLMMFPELLGSGGQQGDVRRLRADPTGIARHEGPGLQDRSAESRPAM